MRVPPFDRYRGFLSGLGLFLSGGIIGSAVFMSIYQYNFTILKLQNIELSSDNNRLAKDNEALTKYKNRQSIISKVNIVLEKNAETAAPLDKAVELEIVGRVRSDLQVVVGQPLSAVSNNPRLYQKLIDRKVYRNIQETDYLVSLKTMLLSSSQLTVWISISPLNGN